MRNIKDELSACITNLNEENVHETKERISRLFDWIELSQSIWNEIPLIGLEKGVATKDGPLQMETSESELPADIAATANLKTTSEQGMLLVRKLSGGVLMGRNKEEIYIPEKIIRLHEFVHGDFIKINNNLGEQSFELCEKSKTEHESDRIELEYCLLSRSSDGLLLASQQMIEGKVTTIKLDGETPHQFLIKESEIQKYNLTEGSVVSIAYLKSDPVTYRVSWVFYDLDTPTKTVAKPKPSSFYKEETEKQETWSQEEMYLLKDKRIVIVGAEFRSTEFNALAADGAFQLEVLTGDENDVRMKAALKDKDLIISASEHSSHRTSILAKECAKKYKIPFRASPTSQSSIKRAMIHGIKDSYIPFYSFF